MSPWRMMNEWGVPPVELHSMLYQYTKQLHDKGEYVPALAVAGGFTFEDQIFKGLALGAPFVKLVGMARSPIAAAMVERLSVVQFRKDSFLFMLKDLEIVSMRYLLRKRVKKRAR